MATTTVRLAQPPAATQDLQAALAEVDRRVGVGVAFNPDPDRQPPPAAVPTGSADLDAALGVGGIPRGRITEAYGPEGAAKTTLALSVIAQAQQAGGTACFIDTEHALDLAWATTLGVDLERLVVCRPEHGVQANLLSQALRKLCGPIARANTAVLVTNQLRQRAGTPGTPLYTSGGRALGYYASVRLDLRPLGPIRDGGQILGSRIQVVVPKNKVAPAWQTAELEVRNDRGLLGEAGWEAASA
jgi:recombination protein RecA